MAREKKKKALKKPTDWTKGGTREVLPDGSIRTEKGQILTPEFMSASWSKGQSGNPGGRPKNVPGLNQILADVLGEEDPKTRRSRMEKIIRKLCEKAAKGDVRATEILLDRGYGKVTQKLEAEFSEKIIKVGYGPKRD